MSTRTTRKAARARGVCLRADEARTLRGVAVERATDGGEAWEWVVRIEQQGRGEG